MTQRPPRTPDVKITLGAREQTDRIKLMRDAGFRFLSADSDRLQGIVEITEHPGVCVQIEQWFE